MCGIAGLLQATAGVVETEHIARMTASLAHRGPDDEGFWTDPAAGIALGHRRLSILDLSAAGHQPMVSASGRYVIVYNGEIYNHRDLRSDLDVSTGPRHWRGHSDTEVMLAAFEKWGFEEALPRFNGMFAFGLWDRERRSLHLARDRLGEKPLYYGRHGGFFLFGSELKALEAHPAFVRDIDRDSLTLFLRYRYVPSPRSIWKGVSKLPPAHYLTVTAGGRETGGPISYWKLAEVATDGAGRPRVDRPELVDELEALLKDAVGRRMEADVPLGAFLSGGLDSSTIVALMQGQSARPIKTFSIGFTEAEYDEAPYAKAVASHLGTDHTELYVTPADALGVIPRVPEIWDEPFSDSSQLPTFLLSALTRRHVTVSLSGDGGDELFGGYHRYFRAQRAWRARSLVPSVLRPTVGRVLKSATFSRMGRLVDRRLPARLRRAALFDRLSKAASLFEGETRPEFYRHFVSHWKNPAEIVVGGAEAEGPSRLPLSLPSLMEAMMYADASSYLPDDILTKVDRATMAVGLEARVPLLDHRVVEFAWRLPMSVKVRDGVGKWILREVLFRHVPRSLVDRPKMGFGIPLETWLRGPLKEWAEDLLDERRLQREGFFRPAPIREKWREHAAGVRSWHYYLWDVLVFQAWWQAKQLPPATVDRRTVAASSG